MIKSSKFLILLIILIITNSCSNSDSKKENSKINISSEQLYIEAKVALDKSDFYTSLEKFKEVNNKYPLSNEGVRAQIMIAFINYLKLDYENAIYNLNKFIKLYPSHKDIDYAYYILALCYYEQINNEELDGSYNNLSLEYFNQIIIRFPDSKYSKDSQQKILLVKENIAAKHMNIGKFYHKNKKYIAAMNRYKKIIDEHSTTKFTPEALHRLVEIYFSLGLMDEAKKTASVIAYNYPDSKWYSYSYNLLTKNKLIDNKDLIDNKNNNIFTKFKNILKLNANKE
jgi:outer membrane protein assembly factor BamD